MLYVLLTLAVELFNSVEMCAKEKRGRKGRCCRDAKVVVVVVVATSVCSRLRIL